MNPKITVAKTILKRWSATDSEISKILNLDDQIEERIRIIIAIHRTLQMTFGNPMNVNGFMTMKNNNPWWSGRTGLSIIASGKFSDLDEVYSRIRSDLIFN